MNQKPVGLGCHDSHTSTWLWFRRLEGRNAAIKWDRHQTTKDLTC